MSRPVPVVPDEPSFDLMDNLAQLAEVMRNTPELSTVQIAELYDAVADAENAGTRRDLQGLWQRGNEYRQQVKTMRPYSDTHPSFLFHSPELGDVFRFGRYGLGIASAPGGDRLELTPWVKIQADEIQFELKVSGDSPLARAIAEVQFKHFRWDFARRKQTGKRPAYLELELFLSPLGRHVELQYLASPLEFAVLQGLPTALLRELILLSMHEYGFNPNARLRIYAKSVRVNDLVTAMHYRTQRDHAFQLRYAQTRRLRQFYNHHFGLPLHSEYVPLETAIETSAPPTIPARYDAHILAQSFAELLHEDPDSDGHTTGYASDEAADSDEDTDMSQAPTLNVTLGKHTALAQRREKQAQYDFTFSCGF